MQWTQPFYDVKEHTLLHVVSHRVWLQVNKWQEIWALCTHETFCLCKSVGLGRRLFAFKACPAIPWSATSQQWSTTGWTRRNEWPFAEPSINWTWNAGLRFPGQSMLLIAQAYGRCLMCPVNACRDVAQTCWKRKLGWVAATTVWRVRTVPPPQNRSLCCRTAQCTHI